MECFGEIKSVYTAAREAIRKYILILASCYLVCHYALVKSINYLCSPLHKYEMSSRQLHPSGAFQSMYNYILQPPANILISIICISNRRSRTSRSRAVQRPGRSISSPSRTNTAAPGKLLLPAWGHLSDLLHVLTSRLGKNGIQGKFVILL